MHFAVSHLSKIGQSYYLRVTVPEDLRQHVGWREIKRSLQTNSLQRAVPEVQRLSGAVLGLFGLLRGMTGDMVDPQKVQQLIQRVVSDRFKADLHWYEEFRVERESISAAQLATETQAAEERIERLKDELARGAYENQPHIASFVKR